MCSIDQIVVTHFIIGYGGITKYIIMSNFDQQNVVFIFILCLPYDIYILHSSM